MRRRGLPSTALPPDSAPKSDGLVTGLAGGHAGREADRRLAAGGQLPPPCQALSLTD